MLLDYFGFKYLIWDLDSEKFDHFKRRTNFETEIQSSLNESKKLIKPTQVNGDAYSTAMNTLRSFKSFNDLNLLLNPELMTNLQKMGVSNLKKLELTKCWANRMHNGSSGKIHTHKPQNPLSKVITLILYYKVPENSSELIFINPKRYASNFSTISLMMNFPIEKIDKKDKLHIKVREGMCVLHDGRIPHAVSEHCSNLPRETIIFDFEYS